MKAVAGKGKKRIDPYRRGLLAMAHIAPLELGIDDEDRRDILERDFGVRSTAKLTNNELGQHIAYFESRGWRTKGRKHEKGTGQLGALRERAVQIALHTELNEKRFRGLVKKICGVERLEWCGEAVRLKRLLAVLKTISEKEQRRVTRDEH